MLPGRLSLGQLRVAQLYLAGADQEDAERDGVRLVWDRRGDLVRGPVVRASEADDVVGEIRRLLISLIQRYAPDPEDVWSWSRWRRRCQYQARLCHYRRRGYALT